jgi:DNA primase
MQNKVATISQWKDWLLNERYISETIIKESGLAVQADKQLLVIPVRDRNGKFLFNKYRRSPWISEGAKYSYDKGAAASLFGLESITDGTVVIITEGELDSLVLRSLGYNAISTTGGASTFPDEWIELLSKVTPILMYDADKAGIEGMMKVFLKMPTAKIAWTPISFGKDITEVVQQGGTVRVHNAIGDAKHYPTKLEDLRKELLAEKQVALKTPYMTPFHVDLALEFVVELIQKKKQQKQQKVRRDADRTDVENARNYPIVNILPVKGGFTKCIYHKEKTGSMRVYNDNHAYSFCCGKRSDAIDIYKELNGCTFKEAVSALLTK